MGQYAIAYWPGKEIDNKAREIKSDEFFLTSVADSDDF
jgi:hypothetical protein